MAETIKIDLDIDAGSSLKTMGDLEASVESMMDELKQTDVASDRFKELQSSIAGATSKIKDMELGMEGLDMEQKASEFGSFASGLADTATGALALSSALGITNKSSEEMIEGLVQGMAIANTFRGGLEGIVSMQKLLRSSTLATTVATKGGTVAMRIFNTVVKANPIGILITTLVAAVSAFAVFSSSSEEAKEKTEDLDEANKNLNETIRLQQKLLNVKIREVLRKKDIEGAERLVELETELLRLKDMKTDARRDHPDDLQRIFEIQEKINAKTLEISQTEGNVRRQSLKLEQEARDIRIKNMEEEITKNKQRNIDDINNVNITAEQREKWAKERADRNKQLREQIQIIEIEQRNENEETALLEARLDNTITKVKIDNANRLADIRKKIGKPSTEEESKSVQELGKLSVGLQEIDDLLNKGSDSEEGDEIKQEIEKIDKEHTIRLTKIANFERDKTFTKEEADAQRLIAERERLDKLRTVQLNYNLDTEETDLKIARNKLSLSKMTDAEILANTKKTNDKIIEDEKKTAEEKRAIASQTIGVISQGMSAVASLMKTSNQAEIEAAEGNEAKQKKLRKEGFEQQKKFQIASAVMGMAQGIISGLGAPYPMNIAMPIIAGVTGAAQIAKIASTTFTGGGGGGSTPTPSVSTAAPNIRETPDVNLFGQGNEGSEGDSSQFNNQEQPPIQAVVSWSDIDAVQNNDNNIQQEMQL